MSTFWMGDEWNKSPKSIPRLLWLLKLAGKDAGICTKPAGSDFPLGSTELGRRFAKRRSPPTKEPTAQAGKMKDPQRGQRTDTH